MPKKTQEIKDIIEQIKKETGATLTTGDDEKLKFVRVPFNIPELDKIIGGGLVKGKTHLLKGAWSSGKTFLALTMIKNVQEAGGTAAFVDVEKTFDPAWAKMLGIDIDSLLVSQPAFGEQALDVVIALIKANVDIVVLDSVASLVSVAEQEADMQKAFMAVQARMVNEALKKITSINQETVFIAINQERQGIGGPFVSNVLPAGKGQYFFSSMIIDVGRGDWIKDSDNNRLGFYIKCFTTKNKTAPEQQQCVLPFIFGQGIDEVLGVFSAAVDAGKIDKQKTTYFFEDDKLGVGRNAAIEKLKADNVLFERVKASLDETN